MSSSAFGWFSLMAALSLVTVTGCDDGGDTGAGGTGGGTNSTTDTGGTTSMGGSGGSGGSGGGTTSMGGSGGSGGTTMSGGSGGSGGTTMSGGSGGGGPVAFLDIDFDDPAQMYTLTGFGGAEDSSVVADPGDAANKVAKVTKAGTAELWAGTTISTMPNNSIPALPFSDMATKMTVRVWSPDAGIQIRLKVEDAADPTHSCETEATTTMAGAWETLEFDFSNEAMGTAALNVAYTFNRISIFPNFGVTGAMAGEKIYYFDNVKF